ncbi:uncharacterized protein LOC125239091 isoform X3 [Leguminivora glycinivorella]|uniref:uncharacterized protein LOC125239091 isoform X3 n=1 Tax=Leguminivora glycinivorella TaxID=1035111 RepID=UPI00200DDA5E|nr:uncharacterized protein LOC125239091 isoform X3 [Leguminivora glycinivorella]
MEPYGSVPVFIDVERAPDRYILTQEMCHNLVQNAKMENSSNPESQTFDPASQFQMVQNEPMPSQSGNQDMPAVSTQNEEGGQSEEKKPSLSGKYIKAKIPSNATCATTARTIKVCSKNTSVSTKG